MSVESINLTPLEIDCGVCGETVNADNPALRRAVPFWNGEPTSYDSERDGFKAVCPGCYLIWEQTE